MERKSRQSDLTELTDEFCQKLKQLPFYESFYQNIQKIVSSDEVSLHDFNNTLLSALHANGLKSEIHNHVYQLLKKQLSGKHPMCWTHKEPIEYLRKAQMMWEKRIYKSLNSMCNEMAVVLSSFRLPSDRDDLLAKWNILSTYDIDLSKYRPVYAPKDFLEVLLELRNENYDCPAEEKDIEFSQVPLKVKSLAELKLMYEDISNGKAVLGVCSKTPLFSNLNNQLQIQRQAHGENVLKHNHVAVTEEYLKQIAPHTLRAAVWSQVLDSEVKPWHEEQFNELKKLVGQYDLLVDKLVFKDIQLTVCNDDQYFVFEDLLYQVLLCMTRDVTLADVCRGNSSNPVIALLKGRSSIVSNTVIYPPSGIIPFHGFAMYAAPFCYLYTNPVQLYFSVRSFYTRYWSRLHEVNSHPQGILALCILFQQLINQHEPELCHHFKRINIQPIRIVFKWLMRCFSGHLQPEQVLYLWDIILGYDSLEIVPLLAVSIMTMRKDNLLLVDNQQDVEAILADLSSIRVIPLLQFVLSK